MMNKWWGYRHQDGSIRAKRYFSHNQILEAVKSDFVTQVSDVFDAENKEEALETLKKQFNGKNNL